MITNNFYKLLMGQVFGRSMTFRSTGNEELNASLYWSSDSLSKYFIFSDMSYIDCISFGSGNTAPTVDDYKLESAISKTNLTFSIGHTRTTRGNINVHTSNITITNNNTEDITIREVAFIPSKVYKTISSNSGTSARILLDRTLLDEPLVIPAGGIGKLKYTIEVDFSEILDKFA